ncbi:MAG: NAD(P)/FAD-dependent oxidoreductase, partial [archaeon]|nr:NAD(P)/FAD-dependent oxidoreductase [archaeon]
MSETDILIVGAGPAGTYLAEKLSLKGIDVTVIEKKRVIGKHACSGLVSTRLDRFVKPKECYIENRIYGSTFHSKDSQFTVRKGDMQAYVLNRPVFDRCMADKATTAGAKIKTETIFEAYSVRNHYAYAETDKGVIRSKIIIGCDGAGSTVRRAAGLDKKKHCVNGIIGYSDEKDYSNRVELFYGKDIAPGFFAW